MKYSYTNGAKLRYKPSSIVLAVAAGLFALASSVMMILSTQAASAAYNQGFETDDFGWLDADNSWYGSVDRVLSNTNGITSADGDWHAIFEGTASGPFTRFDGYRDTWTGEWTAEQDVYLDTSWAEGEGFDYSVASSRADGTHLRDYIFHVGVVDGSLLVNGSNNADFFTNPFKLINDNEGDYYEVTEDGWYTLQHHFYDEGGSLSVDLNLIKDGTSEWTATRSNAADQIPSEIGGNRYGWFTHIDVTNGINVDNTELFVTTPDTTAPSVPTHVFPVDGEVLNSEDLYVDWSESTDDLSNSEDITYKYRLYLENPDENTSATVRYAKDYVGSTRHPATGFAVGTPEDSYWWRVQACDEAENCSEFSEATEFVIDNTAPVATIVNPADGDELTETVTLTGEVEDENPENSYFLVENSDGNVVATSLHQDGRTLHEYDWDTTTVEDGDYTIYFETRDEADNKDGSRSNLGDSVVAITVTVDNDVDDKQDCKNGNWTLGVGDQEFVNQGDCVSHFASDTQADRNPDGNRNDNGRRNNR